MHTPHAPTPADDDIRALCRKHGAKACSDAAYAAMEGKRGAADVLGFGEATLPALYRITIVAYALMSDDDQLADLTRASIDAARVATMRGGA